jgi:hypothetical protein
MYLMHTIHHIHSICYTCTNDDAMWGWSIFAMCYMLVHLTECSNCEAAQCSYDSDKKASVCADNGCEAEFGNEVQGEEQTGVCIGEKTTIVKTPSARHTMLYHICQFYHDSGDILVQCCMTNAC